MEKKTKKKNSSNHKKIATNIVNNSNEKENQKQTNQDSKYRNKEKYVHHKWWIDALLFVGGTLLLGCLASLLGGAMGGFKNYQMPPCTVPQEVFPYAWGAIYLAIGISTYLMWRDKEIRSKERKINLILYFVHMGFNVLWPLIFFRLNLPVFAAIWLFATVVIASIVMVRYYRSNIASGVIFNIYSLWLVYALYLNLGLVLLNF